MSTRWAEPRCGQKELLSLKVSFQRCDVCVNNKKAVPRFHRARLLDEQINLPPVAQSGAAAKRATSGSCEHAPLSARGSRDGLVLWRTCCGRFVPSCEGSGTIAHGSMSVKIVQRASAAFENSAQSTDCGAAVFDGANTIGRRVTTQRSGLRDAENCGHVLQQMAVTTRRVPSGRDRRVHPRSAGIDSLARGRGLSSSDNACGAPCSGRFLPTCRSARSRVPMCPARRAQ